MVVAAKQRRGVAIDLMQRWDGPNELTDAGWMDLGGGSGLEKRRLLADCWKVGWAIRVRPPTLGASTGAQAPRPSAS